MKKVAFVLLSSFLLLGACGNKAHKDKGESDRTDGKKINDN